MAYVEPLVMVFQEYSILSTSTNTAALPPCIVGPCFHVVDADADEVLALAGEYTENGLTGHAFPSNASGALIQKESVKFRVKNAVVRLSEELITAAETSVNTVTLTEDTFPAYIAVGDYLAFDGSDSEYRVTSVDPAEFTIRVNKSVPGASFAIERKVPDVYIEYSEDMDTSLDVTSEKFDLFGVTAEVDGVAYPVVRGELYVGYKALRQDLSDVGTIYDVNELEAKLGRISPENPLALGVNVALANTTVGVHFVGIDSDDLAGYTAAKDKLENYSPIYGIVPLTMSVGVLTMFKNHAVQMSQPEMGQWRMAFGCTPLPTEEVIVEGFGILAEDGDKDLCWVKDDDGTFLSSDCDAGDTIVVCLADEEGNPISEEFSFVVSSVPTDDIITVEQNADFGDIEGSVFAAGDKVAYRVIKKLDKEGQSLAIGATSRAYGSLRFVNIWPDVCVIDGEEQPGYYLGCAVAGAIGGLQPHYGLTRLSISGIDAVKHAGDYFNRTQLNNIADGGTFIFVQDAPNAAPYIRHQLTTDRSAIEFQEVSFVKNYDYISYLCKDVLDEYIGRWNVTEATMTAIRTALEGTLETQRLNVHAKIGSPVLSYNIKSIERLESTRDRIEVYADVEFPYPLNTVGLHIVSV